MFVNGGGATAVLDWQGWLARGGGTLGGAVETLTAAVDAAQAVVVDAASDGELLDAAVGLQQLADRLAAVQLAVLERVEARQAYGGEGAVTAASWLRGRTRLDHAQAVRKVEAARRLARLPQLREALAAGAITFEHAAAVTSAAVPRRMRAIAPLDGVLAELARRATPRDVRRAVQRVRDLVDPDGSDAPPLDERGLDERRHLDTTRTIDGLVAIRGLLDQVQGEALLAVLDAFETPDAAGTPQGRRRSGGQRRADALHTALQTVLDRGDTPQVQGVKPHVTAIIDLAELLAAGQAAALRDGAITIAELARDLADQFGLNPDGDAADGRDDDGHDADRDDVGGATARHDGSRGVDPTDGDGGRREARGPAAWLRFTGELDAERARRLLLQARVQAVLTLGPWRVVNVGRTQRSLPAWLRGALEHVHRRCRGPDCDRPITWSQAHHTVAWVDGGDTDVNRMLPLCQAHHDLVTSGGWHVTFDADTGACTWTGPAGQTIHTHPHP